jgi:hypothetical protein
MSMGTLPTGRRHIDLHSWIESQTRTYACNPPRVEVYAHTRHQWAQNTRGYTHEPAEQQYMHRLEKGI